MAATDTAPEPLLADKEWEGRRFTPTHLPPGGLLWRCESCGALVKYHDLDLIFHANWHNRLEGIRG